MQQRVYQSSQRRRRAAQASDLRVAPREMDQSVVNYAIDDGRIIIWNM